ncbi:MAG: restriction endonuclease subunit S [Methylobacter sp.]|uniref:restriction endonuclease subunit S n=1 Tax=Methylobacter sp. TaxID=2051955 RepID=UPI0027303289|nr:restriction endonuclease subunit S [Methylobacter sp.]MDP1664510.1 restriction endonuclease subunit S [Methylobacter sp.]
MSFEAATYQVEQLISKKFLEIGDGYRAKNSELSSTGIPFARAANINDGFKFNDPDFFPEADLAKVGNKISKPGDVVFTSKGTVGRFALVGANTPRFVYSPQLCFWRSLDQKKLLPEYLYYWMNSQEFLNQLGYLKGQTDMADYVSLRDQRKITATIPSTDVQQLVVAVLKPIDDRIALLRKTNTTLEAIAQALFKSWFVDFDPVRAKQQGREPEGMDAEAAALFPDSFEESELGLVPSGWRVAPVGDVVEIVGGGTPNTKETEYWEPAEFAWTTPRDLSGLQSPVLLKTERLLSAKGVLKVSSGLLPIGTLLLSSRAPIGYLAIAQIPLAINQGYIAILPSSQLPPLYMYFWCKQNMEVIKSRANGSTFMEISKKAFRPIPVQVPPVDLLDNFLDVANPIFTRLTENEKQAQTLTTLRDTLLPRLISGQLRLPEAKTLLEETIA